MFLFIDESFFNRVTGLRHYVYAPVAQLIQYYSSCRRRHSLSILPSYTIKSYQPVYELKKDDSMKKSFIFGWPTNYWLIVTKTK